MINFIIGFIVGGMLMMCAIGMVAIQKDKKPRNRVRFFMTSDSIRHPGWLQLWMGKPVWDKKLLMWIQPNNHVFFSLTRISKSTIILTLKTLKI